MSIYITFFIYFALIIFISLGLAYLIMKWTFSSKRYKRLFESFNGLSITGLNSGPIILLSLSLAFIFNQISTVNQSAKLAVLQETDALRTIGRISLNINPEIGVLLMSATRLYAQAFIDEEWPQLNKGKSKEIRQGLGSALIPLTKMSDIVYSNESLKKLPQATSNQLSQLVTRIRENRLTRIDTSNYSIGMRALILALVTTLSTSVMISIAHLAKPRAQFLSNFTLFIVVLTAMYLAYAAQNPFAGLDSIQDTPVREALDRLYKMQLAK